MVTRKTLLVLILVNAFFIFLVVVVGSYLYYPFDKGMYKIIQLKKMHKELMEYKKETGELPRDLEPLYRHYPNNEKLWFGSKNLWYCPNSTEVNDIKSRIRYEVREGEPLLADLGDDAKEGGFGSDLDVGYRKMCTFSFLNYMKTKEFRHACLLGLFISFVFTGSIALQWHSKRAAGKEAAISVAGLVFIAILFGLVEIVLSLVIMVFHVFPHH